MKLNLGCGRSPLEGWVNLDKTSLPGVDIVADLEKGIPLEPGSVDEFRGVALLEHIRDPLALMQELYRVAKPRAIATFSVPYGSSDNAYEDPTHVHRYFCGSWAYFAQPYYHRADYGYRGDWQPENICLRIKKAYVGSPDISRLIETQRNIVGMMIVRLRAIKPRREPLRKLIKDPIIELYGMDGVRLGVLRVLPSLKE